MLFDQLNLTNINLSMDAMKLNFNCYNCSSDGFNLLTQIVSKYQQSINDSVVK